MEAPKCAWGYGDLVDVTRLRDWRWERNDYKMAQKKTWGDRYVLHLD